MTGYARPDVYITEQLAQSSPSLFPALTPAAFVGYTRQGPVVPTIVDSWNAFMRIYGGWTNTADDNLALQVYQYFNNGGRIAYIVRALGTGSASAVLTLQDRQGTPANLLVVTADNPGAWGNTVYIEVTDATVTGRFAINVRIGSASAAPLERFVDLSMNPTDPRNAVKVINAGSTGSSYITVGTPNGWVYASGTSIPTASVTPGGTALAGGADSSAPPTTGASGQLFTALSSLAIVPYGMIVNVVGALDAATINAAIGWASARGDSFIIVDTPFGDTSAQIVTFKATLTQDSHAAIYWPNLIIADPSSTTPGSTRTVSPAGSVMGQIALTDATRGTAKAPAGVNTSLAGVLALETPSPTPSDYDAVAAGHVNGIRYFPQYGFVIWGSDTLKSTQADAKISIRRTLMAIESAIQQICLFAVEEINDTNLWFQIVTQVTSVLQQLYQQGGLKGNTPDDAYVVICDSSNNTAQTIAAGEVHVQVGVALQYPAEFIIINVGQLTGSSTVIEALS